MGIILLIIVSILASMKVDGVLAHWTWLDVWSPVWGFYGALFFWWACRSLWGLNDD